MSYKCRRDPVPRQVRFPVPESRRRLYVLHRRYSFGSGPGGQRCFIGANFVALFPLAFFLPELILAAPAAYHLAETVCPPDAYRIVQLGIFLESSPATSTI